MRTIAFLTALAVSFPAASHAQAIKASSRPATSRSAASRQVGQQDFFTRFDKNHDGFLIQSEIPQRAQDRLMPFDVNEDGKLSKEEFKSSIVPVNKPKPDFANVSYGPSKSMVLEFVEGQKREGHSAGCAYSWRWISGRRQAIGQAGFGLRVLLKGRRFGGFIKLPHG